MTPSADESADRASVASRYCTINLFFAALFLVTGALQMRILYGWLGSTGSYQADVVNALTVGGGVLYTMIVLTLFIPLLIIIERRAGSLSLSAIVQASWAADPDREEGEAKKGAQTPLVYVSRLLLTFSPALVGMLTEALGLASSAG